MVHIYRLSVQIHRLRMTYGDTFINIFNANCVFFLLDDRAITVLTTAPKYVREYVMYLGI